MLELNQGHECALIDLLYMFAVTPGKYCMMWCFHAILGMVSLNHRERDDDGNPIGEVVGLAPEAKRFIHNRCGPGLPHTFHTGNKLDDQKVTRHELCHGGYCTWAVLVGV